MKILFFSLLLAVSMEAALQLQGGQPNPVLTDVREVGGTNYHVHVRINGKPLPNWQILRVRVVRSTKDGLLMEKARQITHTDRSRDRLNRIGGFSGPDMQPFTWSEFVFDGDGEVILLMRYPKANELIAGQKINVLAMRVGNHELKDGVSIAKFDYGRPVDLKAPEVTPSLRNGQ